MPGIQEQKRIVLFLNEEVKKIEAQVEASQSTIALLKEKRKVLIYEAVTGKIKV